jgi:hypothetical protein
VIIEKVAIDLGALIMDEPHSEPMLPLDSPVVPFRDSWGGAWIRIVLVVLHVAMLAAAIALTPAGYFFELGYYVGTVLFFGSIFLWFLLYSLNTRRGVLVFCALALTQAGLIAFIGMRFRTENRAVQLIMAEAIQQRKEWETQIRPFSMDPLFEMCSGKRQLSSEELQELHTRARAAETKLNDLELAEIPWVAEIEIRVAAVSPGAARDFRAGVDSSQPESNKIMKLTRDYFIEIKLLTGFLIERQSQYRVTSEGLVFDRAEDAHAFNEKIDAVARLQEQLNDCNRKAEEAFRQLPAAR